MFFPNKLNFTGSGDSNVGMSFLGGVATIQPTTGEDSPNRKEWATSLIRENAEESEQSSLYLALVAG